MEFKSTFNEEGRWYHGFCIARVMHPPFTLDLYNTNNTSNKPVEKITYTITKIHPEIHPDIINSQGIIIGLIPRFVANGYEDCSLLINEINAYMTKRLLVTTTKDHGIELDL